MTGGIVGLHRLYLRNLWGLVYVPVFVFILVANNHERDARQALSNANNTVRVAESTIEREEPRVASARAGLSDLRAELAQAEDGSFAKRAIERRLTRAEDRITRGRERVVQARADLVDARPVAREAADLRAYWGAAARNAFYLIVLALLMDALLMPPSCEERALAEVEAEEGPRHDSEYATNWIDRLSLFCGEFVSYWAVIAVFVYYYEVIARYVFNSPTNWAHEAMYLMFGMQYLIAGAYAMLTETHVRVDIFYAPMRRRNKAIVDLATSVFFFIFAGTLLVLLMAGLPLAFVTGGLACVFLYRAGRRAGAEPDAVDGYSR